MLSSWLLSCSDNYQQTSGRGQWRAQDPRRKNERTGCGVVIEGEVEKKRVGTGITTTAKQLRWFAKNRVWCFLRWPVGGESENGKTKWKLEGWHLSATVVFSIDSVTARGRGGKVTKRVETGINKDSKAVETICD